jgi:geranylgeranyl pyrophosphate synthase
LRIPPIFKPIERDLQQVEERLLGAIEVAHAPLAQAMLRLIGDGGKRLRPALVILSARLVSTDPALDPRVWDLAASVELLHTATLVHDDLVDQSLLRRGCPTLNSTWSDGVVVLAGDYLFSQAADMVARTGNSRIVSLFSETLKVICNGELRHIFNSGDWTRSKEDYCRHISSKTASLFATSAQAGGILAGGLEPSTQALREFGHSLGMAFQITDDVLDFVGEVEELGKPIGSDLRQGTVTLPSIYFLNQHEGANPLPAVLSQPEPVEEDILAFVQMVRESPAIEASLDDARRFAQQARGLLADLSDNPYRDVLLQLTEYVVERTI